MMVLALIGAGVTLANVSVGREILAEARSGLRPDLHRCCLVADRTLDRTVIRQVLHWLAVGVMIAINFSICRQQRRADIDRDRTELRC